MGKCRVWEVSVRDTFVGSTHFKEVQDRRDCLQAVSLSSFAGIHHSKAHYHVLKHSSIPSAFCFWQETHSARSGTMSGIGAHRPRWFICGHTLLKRPRTLSGDVIRCGPSTIFGILLVRQSLGTSDVVIHLRNGCPSKVLVKFEHQQSEKDQSKLEEMVNVPIS